MKVFASTPIAALAFVLALPLAPDAHAQPVSNSTLYYRMGGGSPSFGALNRSQMPVRLGFGSRVNYSCGKFDVGLSWSNVMNGLGGLGTTFTNAIRAGIASLPLYILQRAQPGLYQLFQNFSQKADLLVSASVKTCEETERSIKNGQDPYEDWVRMAKGDAWKARVSSNGDVIEAKMAVERREEGQNNGVSWVYGTKAGGRNSQPIQPIRDLSVAGYNATLNRPVATSPTANYSGSSAGASRLVRAFRSPEDLAAFSTNVLGDRSVYLCTQGSDCPQPTTTTTAAGLGPAYERELDTLTPLLQELAESNTPKFGRLQAVSAPGMAISPQLMEAVHKMPADTQAVALSRLAQELAMQRVVDKALVARNVLITGLSLPEATAAGEMTREVQQKIDRMTQYINDLMFEFRIRKEMTADTALAIMGSQLARQSQSMRVPDAAQSEQQPLEDGRVGTTPSSTPAP